MYTVEPVPRVVYIGFAHSQVSSTLHADAIRISQESAGSLQDLKRRTRAGKHAYIHTYKHMMMMPRIFFCLSENAECARKERKTKSKTSYCEFISVASFPPTTATGHGAHFLSTLSGFDRNASSPFLSFFTFDRGSSFRKKILFGFIYACSIFVDFSSRSTSFQTVCLNWASFPVTTVATLNIVANSLRKCLPLQKKHA